MNRVLIFPTYDRKGAFKDTQRNANPQMQSICDLPGKR